MDFPFTTISLAEIPVGPFYSSAGDGLIQLVFPREDPADYATATQISLLMVLGTPLGCTGGRGDRCHYGISHAGNAAGFAPSEEKRKMCRGGLERGEKHGSPSWIVRSTFMG